MFPRRKSIWMPLLKVLDEAGGPLKPSDAIERVERHFPELTDEDKQYKTPTGYLRWSDHDVPWARYDLVKKGLMVKNQGKWQISDEGHAYLIERWNSWAPEYVQTKSDATSDGSEPAKDGDDARLPTQYWWVNQGQSYDSEREGRYVWAPLHTNTGATLGHWERVSGILPGDVLVHYSNGAVHAISIAEKGAEQRDNPHSGSHNAWENQGWATTVHYYELSKPYLRENFSEDLLRMNMPDGPFDRRGQVKQGYLWNFSLEAFHILAGDPSFPWPSAIPLDRPSAPFTHVSGRRKRWAHMGGSCSILFKPTTQS
ncbi:MAG: winged helix-turn-helix domain-containing protein [Firmicutes bacterium]|nr:winged helix-turn-helix domain-containing protein [Bacillota bacterium]